MFADFEKAFDSVDHNSIFKTLQYFNFGNDFFDWIKLFYTDAQSCVSNNGHSSDFFNINRGVRQGCPLSPYVFLLAIEVLYKNVVNDKNINGVLIQNKEIKYTAFADDATFLLQGNKSTFESLINLIDKFSSISGLKLNTNKSIVLRVGSLKHSLETFCNNKKFIWTNEKASTLGIVFTNDKDKNV